MFEAAIIPQATSKQQSWQHALSEMVTDPMALLSYLKLSPEQIPWQWDKQFPLRTTRSFMARMQKGNPFDPLLRQVLSVKEESYSANNFSKDPLQESEHNPAPGLIHKFHGRVLLTFTSSCAIHCRYCFRRHFPYEKNNPGRKGWSDALTYIANNQDIQEVILSGGDPLMAQNNVIAQFLTELALIEHVKIVRFHTRLPVVIPERIEPELLQVLKETRFQTVMVYHINHPAEIIPEIAEGVSLLKQNNITVLNQSVLLAGVNDNEECLISLSYRLLQAGILPYYVNLLDQVQGASHFAVSSEKAKKIEIALRNQLPGYLVPKFVQEIPHMPSKIPLNSLS